MTDPYWNTNGNGDIIFDPDPLHPHHFLGTTNDTPLIIETNGKEAMRIDPQGHVLVGTGATKLDANKLDAKLHVTSRDPQIHVTGLNTSAAVRLTSGPKYTPLPPPNWPFTPGTTWDIKVNDNDGNMHFSKLSEDNVSVDNVMTLTTTDQVGIGTTVPDAKLHVSSEGNINAPQVLLEQITQEEPARLRFSGPAAIPVGDIPPPPYTAPFWEIKVGPGNTRMGIASGNDDVMSLDRGGVYVQNRLEADSIIVHGSIDATGNIRVVGNMEVAGVKHFVQAHPNDPAKEIVYTSLEGSEAGTYMRGTWKLENGKAVIELPEHFSMVTSEDGLTVQLTPRGEWLQLYVVQLNTKQIVVQEAQGKSGQFDYLIQGVRKGYEHYEVVREK